MRYIHLTEDQLRLVEQLYKQSSDHRERQRAQALLLSHRGYRIEELSLLFEVNRDTISQWFDYWEGQLANTILHLQDAARSGRPSKLSFEEKKR